MNFEALTADHHALTEAFHGMLGRVLMLESRVDHLERMRPAGSPITGTLAPDVTS